LICRTSRGAIFHCASSSQDALSAAQPVASPPFYDFLLKVFTAICPGARAWRD
jgi:hypothetical protein